MSLPGVKKRSSVGRVRMAFTHPQTTLVNYYVGGAGVGAVSTSNRRALRSRASWRPTQDGKGSTRCGGFCQPNRFANNVEFMRQGGRGAVNDKPEIVTRDDNTLYKAESLFEDNSGCGDSRNPITITSEYFYAKCKEAKKEGFNNFLANPQPGDDPLCKNFLDTACDINIDNAKCSILLVANNPPSWTCY